MSQNDQHLQAALTIWTAAFEHIADGIAVCDASDNLLLVNPALREMMDLSSDAPLPQRFSDLPLERYDAPYGISKIDADAQYYSVGEHTLRCIRSPALSNNGHALGSLLVLHDVTAEVANRRAVVDFVATMSDKLRTPLTPIFINIDLLLHGFTGPLNQEQTDMLWQVRQRASDINDVVKNVILTTSIMANTLVWAPEPLDVYFSAHAAIQSVKSNFAAKNLDIRNEIYLNLPPVFADCESFRIILFQLLNNACHFTYQGAVALQAHEQGAMIRIDVIDTGIGIPQEAQINLFEPFFQVSHTRSEHGSGLGLYIVRTLVELQGGRVWVESTPGQGSTFSFTLPQAVPEK